MKYGIVLGSITKDDKEAVEVLNEVYKIDRCIQILRGKWV